MKLILIAAVADNGVIGAAGTIPWQLREDLRRFRQLTWGHPLIMGRKTYESIGKPLGGRRNIVLSRQAAGAAGVELFGSLESVLRQLRGEGVPLVFVIGGAEVYRQALPLADELQITHVHQQPAGDTFFPAIDPQQWQAVSRESHPGYSFVEYHRRRSA